MGRPKLQLKLIPDASRRRATYRKRISNLKKRAYELSTLCDIGVALISVGPDDQVQTWPENKHELIRIVKKFISLNKGEQTKRQVTLSDYLDGQVRKLKANLAQLQSSASEFTVEAEDRGLTHQSPVSMTCDAFGNSECDGTNFDELLPIGEDSSFSQSAIWQSMGYSGDQVLDSTSAPMFVTTDDKQGVNSSFGFPMSFDPTIAIDGFGDAVNDTVFNTIGEDCIFSLDAIWPSMDYSSNQVLDSTSAPLFVPTDDNHAVNSSSGLPMSFDPTIGFDGFGNAVNDTVFDTMFSSPSPFDHLMDFHYMDDGVLPMQLLESNFAEYGENFS